MAPFSTFQVSSHSLCVHMAPFQSERWFNRIWVQPVYYKWDYDHEVTTKWSFKFHQHDKVDR